jgi:nitrate reductase delta subunit
MKTFKALGLLMSYPAPEWLAHLDEIGAPLAEEGLLPKRQLRDVLAFIDELKVSDPYEAQESYVSIFDRGRLHSLHLFEHIHGESRDRGQAMVNLAEAYAEQGFFIGKAELPDYLPLFLEFLSLCDFDEAVKLLGEPVDILAAIATRLHKRHSSYAALFDALVSLSKAKPSKEKLQAVIDQPPEHLSLEALDREWEEAAAFAGKPQQAGCNGCQAAAGGLQVKIKQAGGM